MIKGKLHSALVFLITYIIMATGLLGYASAQEPPVEPPYSGPIAVGNQFCPLVGSPDCCPATGSIYPAMCNLCSPRELFAEPSLAPREQKFGWTSLLFRPGSTSEYEDLMCAGIPYHEVCNSPGIFGIPGTSYATFKDFKSLMCDPTFDSANKEKDLSGNVTGWGVLIPIVDRVDPMSAPDPNPVIGYAKVHIIAVCYPGSTGCRGAVSCNFSGFCIGGYKIVIDRISCFPCAGPSDISVNPTSFDFGNIPVGIPSEAQTLTILNDGNGILAIYPLQINGTHYSEFSIQNDNCSGKILLPLENCTVDLVFSPTSGGSKNANLSITSNDPDTPTLDVPLSGTGTPLGNAPREPSNLNATSIAASRIKLTWTDNSTDETSFKIYRKKDSGSWKLIATKEANVVSHINWTAAGNTTTTTYSYYVKACNSSGCSPSTKWAVVPYKPTALTVTASSSNQIDLTWTDTSNNETGFQIYKKTGNCSTTNSWVEITQMGPNITSYSDTDLPSGTIYSYKVRAYRESSDTPYSYGYSSYTNCKSATTP